MEQLNISQLETTKPLTPLSSKLNNNAARLVLAVIATIDFGMGCYAAQENNDIAKINVAITESETTSAPQQPEPIQEPTPVQPASTIEQPATSQLTPQITTPITTSVPSQETITLETTNINTIEDISALGLTIEQWCGKYLQQQRMSAEEIEAFLSIIERESNFNPFARNLRSGAYGLPQSLPAEKMQTKGDDYITNPRTQLNWMIDYIYGRYGGPLQAWAFWQNHHYY